MVDGQEGLRGTLIAAALAMLDADGEEPSLRAVARAAGVSAMAPYNHFADKGALLAAVANRGFEMLGDELTAADDDPEPRAALAAQGLAFVAFAQAHPALYRLMYSYRHGDADTEAVRATYTILARRVAGIVPQQASAATLACRSLVQGLAAIALEGRLAPSGPGDVAEAIWLFVASLGTDAGNPGRTDRTQSQRRHPDRARG